AAIPFIAGAEYMVRAVKLEVSPSGSYYNLSSGVIATTMAGGGTEDCLGSPGGSALPGTPCNDGNPNTTNDTWTSDCDCEGTVTVLDCEGTPNGTSTPGSPCNDGMAGTGNDTWTADCECIGQPIDCAGVAGGTAFIDNCGTCIGGTTGLDPCLPDCNGTWGGTAVIDNCGDCVGGTTGNTACIQDCNGIWGGTAMPGTACNDGNANTINDTWNSNCQCVGTLQPIDCA